MKFCHCPRCQRESLFQTGAFWVCGVCGYAITQSALTIDESLSKKSGEQELRRYRKAPKPTEESTPIAK